MVFEGPVDRVTWSVPSQFPGLGYGEEVIVWSNSCPDPVPDFFVLDSVSESDDNNLTVASPDFFVLDSVSESDDKNLPVASHFEDLIPSFQFSCEGPSFACKEEG